MFDSASAFYPAWALKTGISNDQEQIRLACEIAKKRAATATRHTHTQGDAQTGRRQEHPKGVE
jgi:hypothetical protein